MVATQKELNSTVWPPLPVQSSCLCPQIAYGGLPTLQEGWGIVERALEHESLKPAACSLDWAKVFIGLAWAWLDWAGCSTAATQEGRAH